VINLRSADDAIAGLIERLVWKLRSLSGSNHPMMLSAWRIAVVSLSMVAIGLTFLEDRMGAVLTACAAGIFMVGILRDLRATWSDSFEPWTPQLHEKYARRSAFQKKSFPALRIGCLAATIIATGAIMAWPPETGEAIAAPMLLMFWFLSIGGYVECSRPELPDQEKRATAEALGARRRP